MFEKQETKTPFIGTAQTPPAVPAAQDDLASFYKNEDDGFDFGGNQLAVPLLLINQPTTKSSKFGEAKVEKGHFYNSNTLKDYGTKIKVTPVFATVAFYEWGPNQSGLQGRYSPAEFEALKKSGDIEGEQFEGFYRVLNSNGERIAYKDKSADLNRIVETWVYIFVLADHKEDGFICYGSTVGNIKYLKQFNSAVSLQRFPSGEKAPKTAQIWEIGLKEDETKKGTSYHFGSGGKADIRFCGFVPKQDYIERVKPVMELAPSAALRVDMSAALDEPKMLAAPEVSVVSVEKENERDVPF